MASETKAKQSFTWAPMTVDQYAEFERINGSTVVKAGGIWWRAARRFFYRPLFPFVRSSPDATVTPPSCRFGGYQHLVPDGAPSNSFLNLFLFDDLKSYQLADLRKTLRRDIRKSLAALDVRPIRSLEEFVDGAYPAYLSFFNRTHYQWRSDRVQRQRFIHWAESLYRFPQILCLGVYREGKMGGVNISYLIDRVIVDAVSFCTMETLKLGASDLFWHVMREQAALADGIDYIYEGMPTGRLGIDQSKILRGCKVVSWPAYYRMNPMLEFGLRSFRKPQHKKLLGLSPDEVREVYSLHSESLERSTAASEKGIG